MSSGDSEAKLHSRAFVRAGSETEPGEYSADARAEHARLRITYPEIAHWGDVAIAEAWMAFSDEVDLLRWAQWGIDERREEFIEFLSKQQ
jgi:hypothetical protein